MHISKATTNTFKFVFGKNLEKADSLPSEHYFPNPNNVQVDVSMKLYRSMIMINPTALLVSLVFKYSVF